MNDVDLAIAVAEVGSDVVRRCFGTILNRVDKAQSQICEAIHGAMARPGF